MGLGDIVGSITGANAAKNASKKAAAAAAFKPLEANTIFGSGTIDPKTGLNYGGGPGSSLVPGFTNASQMFLQQLLGGGAVPALNLDPNQVMAGATQAGQSYLGQFGQAANPFFSAANKWAQGLAGFNPDEFAAQQYDRLTSLAQRGEETATQKALGGLFARGRLGANDTTAGNVLGELDRAQQDAATNRALQSIGLAQQEAASQLGIASGAAGQAGSLLGQGEQLGSNAMSRFLGAIQGGTAASGFLNTLQESLLSRAIMGTQGVAGALAPSNQGIQNLLAAAGLVNGQNATVANALMQGGNAAAAAQGNLVGSLIGGISGAWGK